MLGRAIDEASAFSLGEYCTCKGVMAENPWRYLEKTSEFSTDDTVVFAWAKLLNVCDVLAVRFQWIKIDDSGRRTSKYLDSWKTQDPQSDGYTCYSWYVLWGFIPVSTRDTIGKWAVSLSIDGKQQFELAFTVIKSPYKIERTETYSTTKTVTSVKSSTSYFVSTSLTFSSAIVPFPAYILEGIVVGPAVPQEATFLWDTEQVQAGAPTKFCRRCGAKTPRDTTSCQACGADLT
jgi:hypothetical protein